MTQRNLQLCGFGLNPNDSGDPSIRQVLTLTPNTSQRCKSCLTTSGSSLERDRKEFAFFCYFLSPDFYVETSNCHPCTHNSNLLLVPLIHFRSLCLRKSSWTPGRSWKVCKHLGWIKLENAGGEGWGGWGGWGDASHFSVALRGWSKQMRRREVEGVKNTNLGEGRAWHWLFLASF